MLNSSGVDLCHGSLRRNEGRDGQNGANQKDFHGI